MSAISPEELRCGLGWKPRPRIARCIDDFIETEVEVLPVTGAIARRGGALRGGLQAIGRPRRQPDLLIAATALEHDLPLVTRNVRDFEGCGIALLNPFVGD